MSFYPIYLTRLHEQKVVLLGGNEEAERKTEELLSFNANVHVISLTLTDRLSQLHQEGSIEWTAREYSYGDLEGAAFAIAADYTPDIAQTVSGEAKDRNLLINVMDNIPLSNAAFGSVIRQGKLTVSFSTNGLAPALAVRLKERFREELDDAYAEFLEIAGTLRDPVMQLIRDPELRKQKWYEWVDTDTLDLLRKGDRSAALDATEAVWGHDVMNKAGLRIETGIISRILKFLGL